MAYVRTRHRPDGSPYYTVYWRAHGRRAKQECMSWDTLEDADHCKRLVEQFGGEKAREVMKTARAPRRS